MSHNYTVKYDNEMIAKREFHRRLKAGSRKGVRAWADQLEIPNFTILLEVDLPFVITLKYTEEVAVHWYHAN